MAAHTAKPTVSIVCITYNQARFIKQALDGFLMQKTDFVYEILIHDDCSTDGTKEIIQEYKKRHPSIIKSFYEKENQYSKGYFDFINKTFAQSEADFIAFCEGDDYWTDSSKLQMQVDYMRKHPKTTLLFHPVRVVFENHEQDDYVYPQNLPVELNTLSLLKNNYIQSNSVLYRRQDVDYSSLPSGIIPSDWYMHLYHSKFGDIGFIKETMSVYRKHDAGVWWGSQDNQRAIWLKHGVPHLKMYYELLRLFDENKQYKEVIISNMNNLIGQFVETDMEAETHLIRESIKSLPDAIENFVKFLYEIHLEQNREHDKLVKLVADVHIALDDKDKKLQRIERELRVIKQSRVWRVRSKLLKFFGKPV